MSAAPAPARKIPVHQSANDRLMLEMGSTRGADPIPPDQYLYFLGKKEPPLQRLLALVRSTTIRYRHRSPHCVDEAGRDLKLLQLEKLLGMDHGNFMRTWSEAVARGLVRRDDPRHPHRIYLCGSVKESVGYRGEEKVDSVCTDTFLTPAQKEIVAGWPKERQTRFYAEFERAVKYKRQLEADAIALAREAGDHALDQVLTAHALPKKRLPKRREPTSQLVQLTLVSSSNSSVFESVQTQSVQTDTDVSVRTDKRESVPSAASLLPSEKTEGVPRSVGQSTEEPADRPPTSSDYGAKIAELKTLLTEEYGRRFPGEPPSTNLCSKILAALSDAPLELLRERMRQRIRTATGMGFALLMATDVGQRWEAEAGGRATAEAAELRRQDADTAEARRVAAATLRDPRATSEEKRFAEEVLNSLPAVRRAGAGS